LQSQEEQDASNATNGGPKNSSAEQKSHSRKEPHGECGSERRAQHPQEIVDPRRLDDRRAIELIDLVRVDHLHRIRCSVRGVDARRRRALPEFGKTGKAVPAVASTLPPRLSSLRGCSSARGDATAAGAASSTFCEPASGACLGTAGLITFATAGVRGASRSRFACAFSLVLAGCLAFFCG